MTKLKPCPYCGRKAKMEKTTARDRMTPAEQAAADAVLEARIEKAKARSGAL